MTHYTFDFTGRTKAKPAVEYRPVVQFVNLPQTAAWAVSQPLNFEGGKIGELMTDKFMSDRHVLKLLPDVPPYVGRISVQLLKIWNRESVCEIA